MEIKPIKTKILKAPKDNLLEAIKDSELGKYIKEKSVLVVTSKVVSIDEGRCVLPNEVDKEKIIKEEADIYIKEADSRWRICLKHGTFLAGSGVDESNANNHLILLPEKPHESAKRIYEFIKKEYGLSDFGIIISDSHSMPMRYGTLGVAIGWFGFHPVTYFTGKPDLFGRPAQFTRINTVDSLAVAGVFAMGELSEQTPLCVINNVPHIKFSHLDTSKDLTIPPREDIYWPLLKRFYE